MSRSAGKTGDGWLWRKFAAGTMLVANEIQIDPCCNFIPVE
jgi:hypothetical protein